MKDATIVLIGRLIQALSAVVILRLMTSYFDVEAMGLFGIFTSIAMFFSLFFINPLWMYSYRHIHEWKIANLLWPRTVAILTLIFFVAAASFGLSIIGLVVYKPNWSISILTFSVVLAGFVFFQNANQTVIPFFNMLGARPKWVIYNSISILLGIVLAVFFVQQSVRIEFWIAGIASGLAIGGLLATYDFRRSEAKRDHSISIFNVSAAERKDILRFCTPLAFAVGLSWAQFQSYRILLEYYLTIDFLGKFVTGYLVAAGLLTAFETTVQQYFYPLLYRQVSEMDQSGQWRAWKSYSSFIIPIYIFSALALFVLADLVVQIFLDPKFWDVVWFVQLGCFVELTRMVGNVYGIGAHVAKQTQALVKPQAMGAFVVLAGLPTLFYSGFGQYFGLLLAVGGFVFVVMMHFKIKSLLGASPDWSRLVYLVVTLPFLGLVLWLPQLDFESWVLAVLRICVIGIGALVGGYWLWKREFAEKNS